MRPNVSGGRMIDAVWKIPEERKVALYKVGFFYLAGLVLGIVAGGLLF